MRNIVLIPFVLALACTKHNPEACCSTPDQCSTYGLSGITSCDGAEVCNSTGACVAPQCTTNTDCTDPTTPLCVNQLCVAPQCTTNTDCTDLTMPFCENNVCVAACGSDADCAGTSGKPYCAASGLCVACETDAMCTAQAPVCDGSAFSCRGCVADSECSSGICLESNGTCADTSQAVFVDIGGSDVGTCPKSNPCATMQYAFGEMTGSRNVLKVLPTTWATETTIVVANVDGYIDGSITTMTGTGSDGLFSVQDNANITLSGFTMSTSAPMTTPIADIRSGEATFYGDDLLGFVNVNGGTLTSQRSSVGTVYCNFSGPDELPNGTVKILQSNIQSVETQLCAVSIEQSTFDETVNEGSPIRLGSATAPFTIENNVIVGNDAFLDAVSLDGPSGSVFRFNTLVNLSGEDETAQPLSCQSTGIDVSNNIVAWHTSQAIHCSLTNTLVDSLESLPPGTGNQVGSASTFFVDMANKDFHLAAGSPALHAAASGVDVMVDHDGSARPEPANTNDDVGAYESPM